MAMDPDLHNHEDERVIELKEELQKELKKAQPKEPSDEEKKKQHEYNKSQGMI